MSHTKDLTFTFAFDNSIVQHMLDFASVGAMYRTI